MPDKATACREHYKTRIFYYQNEPNQKINREGREGYEDSGCATQPLRGSLR
jgi:hypothetical protein